MRSATSRWNISTSESYHGGHGSTREPADQQRGRDVVGQVGDDARRAAVEMRRADRTSSASPATIVEPAGIVRGDLRERRDGARRRARPRSTRRGAFGEQRARQPAGSGADLDHGDAVERAGGAGDAARSD